MNNQRKTILRFLFLCVVGLIAPLHAHGFLTTSDDFEGYASGTVLSQNVIVQTILGLGNSQWALFTSGGGQLSFTGPAELSTGSHHISFNIAITQQPQVGSFQPPVITTFGSVNPVYSGLGISFVNYNEYVEPIHHEYISVGSSELAYELYQIFSVDMFIDIDGHTASTYVDDVLLQQLPYDRNNYPWPITGITFDNSIIRQAEFAIDNFSWVSTIPEPSSLSLCLIGAFALSLRKSMRRKKTQQLAAECLPQSVGSPDP